MLVTVAEIIASLHQQKKTCVLALHRKDDAEPLRIFLRDGEVRSLVLGNRRGTDCLKASPGFRCRRYSVAPCPAEQIPDVDLLSADAIGQIARQAWTVECDPETAELAHVKVAAVPSEVMSTVEDAIIGIAGPVALVMLEQGREKLGLPRGGQLSPGVLERLLHLLAADLSVNDRSVFLRKIRRLPV